MLKLKPLYLGHLMQRADSLEKTLMLAKIKDRRRRGDRMRFVGWHHQFNGHEFEQTVESSEGQGSMVCCGAWGPEVSAMT